MDGGKSILYSCTRYFSLFLDSLKAIYIYYQYLSLINYLINSRMLNLLNIVHEKLNSCKLLENKSKVNVLVNDKN